MDENPYRKLADRLNALPNGFPPAPDGAELRLLAKLFTPEEAALAAQLRMTRETASQIAGRVGGDPQALRKQLKNMASRGLIAAGRAEGGLGYGLLPFVVGIFEAQGDTIDAELARLFEDYYRQSFGQSLQVRPAVHRVLPVGESVRQGLETRPFESVAAILSEAKAWGVNDCICRKQQALIGKPCGHPIDICMVVSQTPGAFDNSTEVHALTLDQAMATLRRAAEAGLVHSVTNNRKGVWYICNCCTCGCGVLRGMAELGIANVVAKSAFVNTVDESLCSACEDCLDVCQFGALTMDGVVHVDAVKCAGCGLCVPACPQGALGLVRRDEVVAPPVDERGWMEERRRLATD